MAAVTAKDPTVRSGSGLIFRLGDPGFEARRSGFNLAVDHHPAVIVDAGSPADVVFAVRLAARQGRPLAVMNTGHGPSVPADGAVLVRTGRLRRVDVDPGRRTARVEGGAVWRDVIDAAARHGLAPLNGSSPAVGVAGYTLGGGVGLLARRFGFAADHVRSVDLVTADGRRRHVTADADPDLFWALRGAGANFGVVTALEIDLFPVATLLGGELCFTPDVCADVLATYADWAGDVPDTMASSVLLLTYPDDPALAPDPALRGRHVTHVRVADSSDDHAEGRRWVERLRRTGPRLVDTVRVMPYADVGTIHHEPVDTPVPAFDRNVLLSRFDVGAAATLARHTGPAAAGGVLAELRAWGGALSRPADPPDAVGGRDAQFSLLAIADPDPGTRARRDGLLDGLRPWSTGGSYPNFSGVEDTSAEAVRRGYRPEDFARLRQIKAAHDPDNRFRVNFNIPPEGRTLR